MDPDTESGKNGVYASDRARQELLWKPSGLQEQVTEYLTWAWDNAAVLAASR
ncbi:hypothetical protein ACFWMQ_21205 [Streptomyces sp. NPDC058372]|uniref:hypothetical protein n=1 Tax=Streptomyces sp. NPDC058372 TaxID=3346464 RepID=UPI003650D8C3